MITFLGSLVICLSFASMWIIAWVTPWIYSPMTAGYCTSYSTVFGVSVVENQMPKQTELWLQWMPWGRTMQRYSFIHFGVWLNIRSTASGELGWMLFMNFWIPQLAALLLMAGALRSMLRRRRLLRRARSNLCAQCGYDLRATPDRCPECGTIPEKKN